ncbi:MAG: nucleoside transporter [Kiritimatiellaeota bacterium]|nr:nucleoside transporter [Kiritimatiellota bacterium]
MDRYNLISFGSLFVLIFLGWLLSANRKVFNWRAVVGGLTLQLVFGAFIFFVPAGATVFLWLNDAVMKVLDAAQAGLKFCFGPLAAGPGQPGSIGFILAFQALPTIVFFATLMDVLYYLKVMQYVVNGFTRLFSWLMRISGAESLCTASNIFVGIEASVIVRPYLATMTRSELALVLTSGFATVASSTLGLYVMLLHQNFPTIAGHLMSASLLGAPAAIVMSKLLIPETEQPETLGQIVPPHYDKPSSLIESAINGANAGGKLVMGVIVLLLAFLGLMELVNLGLDGVAVLVEKIFHVHYNLRLENLLAYVFYPFALLIGVSPADAWEVGRLLGMRFILTEIPAYQELARLMASGGLHDPRSAVLASYALCGFAHIPSIAIFVGGTAALAPNQTKNLAAIAFRALLAATLACLMIAAIAGTFYGHGALVLTPK